MRSSSASSNKPRQPKFTDRLAVLHSLPLPQPNSTKYRLRTPTVENRCSSRPSSPFCEYTLNSCRLNAPSSAVAGSKCGYASRAISALNSNDCFSIASRRGFTDFASRTASTHVRGSAHFTDSRIHDIRCNAPFPVAQKRPILSSASPPRQRVPRAPVRPRTRNRNRNRNRDPAPSPRP